MIDINTIRLELKDEAWTANSFSVLTQISLVSNQSMDLGRELIIRALERKEKLIESHQQILEELAIHVGLYPYVLNLPTLSLRSAFVHAAHRAEGNMEDFVLHSAQARVLRRLMSGQSVILSAPTSFGKSLLIDILIAAKDFANIVLIVPTLALVEETRRRISRFDEKYSVITSLNQKFGDRNIFVLTQERYLAIANEIPSVDFFVIDEFYKLSISTEGDRATRLNQAFLKLLSTNAQFYLLGPSIREIPSIVKDKTRCAFLIEDFHTVAIELHQISKKPNKEEALAFLLDKIDGQTMIYCQSPASTRKLLKKYLNLRELPVTTDQELLEAARWTSIHFHNQWLISVALRHGIGIHHGRLPRSLGRFMVRAFEEKKIKVLLCTSTLIEGVNTTAKNVIVYDNVLNRKPLDFFTFNNIRGRSGRMFRHFVGHVYLFDAPPQEDLPFVDIPALNPTSKTPSSLLIQIPSNELPGELLEKVNKILEQDFLPSKIIKSISGIEPEYLIDTAKYLIELDVRKLAEFSWSSRPQYESIKATSEIIWHQLGGATAARTGGMLSASMMTKWIWDLYKYRNVPRFRRETIANQINRGTIPDEAVENVLAFLRSWASFNYPKYLVALSEISNYVLLQRGLKGCNYQAFAVAIEHLFQPDSFSALEEYGLPAEISERLLSGKIFSADDTLDKVVRSLKNKEITKFAQNTFEKRIIEDFQEGIGVKILRN